MPNHKIMIVEDEEIVAADIQTSIEKMGYAVCAMASSGMEAIKKAGSTRPDLILMDIVLKGNMDGIEAATRIKELYKIPVVYLTAFGDDSILQRAKVAEPYGYITKPFSQRELEIAIEISIYKKQAEDRIHKMELWLATVLKSIGDAVIASDKDRRITFMNSIAEKLTGWNQEDALGKNLTEVLNIKDRDLRDLEKHLVEKVITEGLIINLIEDRLLIAKDGSELPISDSAAPIKNDNNESPGSVIVFRDITEHKQAAEALKISEEKYRTLFESSRDAIMTLAPPSWRFTTGNQATVEMFNACDEAAFTALGPWTLSPEFQPDGRSSSEKAAEMIQSAMSKGSHFFEWTHRRQGGESFPSTVLLTRMEIGGQTLLQATVRDITEHKRAEAEKAKLEIQLLQTHKMEAIGTLAGGIAHDFNNILAAMIGYTELSLVEDQKEIQRQYLQETLKGAERAKDLVKQILTFSRQDSREKKPQDIKLLLKEAVKFLRASMPATIEFRQDFTNESCNILADYTQVYQVIMNLCANAAYAMKQTGGILSIELSTLELARGEILHHPGLKPGPYVRLTVSDTGCGIDSALIPRIFDPFFTTKTKEEGTGLGLSVVYGIVKSHNGVINVYSELGKGASFSVYLPRIIHAAVTMGSISEAVTGGTEQILFVDDEPALVDIGILTLSSLGYTVTGVTSSNEALDLFRAEQERFDLVITDMTLPKMTGIDLTREILQIRPDMPVILCSGLRDPETEEQVKSLGIRAYCTKPLTKNDLSRVVRDTLDGDGI